MFNLHASQMFQKENTRMNFKPFEIRNVYWEKVLAI